MEQFRQIPIKDLQFKNQFMEDKNQIHTKPETLRENIVRGIVDRASHFAVAEHTKHDGKKAGFTLDNRGKDIIKNHSEAIKDASLSTIVEEYNVIQNMRSSLKKDAPDYNAKNASLKSLSSSVQIRMRDAVRASLSEDELTRFDAQVNELVEKRKSMSKNERSEYMTLQELFDQKAKDVLDKKNAKLSPQAANPARRRAMQAMASTGMAAGLLLVGDQLTGGSVTKAVENFMTPTPALEPKKGNTPAPIAPERPSPTSAPRPVEPTATPAISTENVGNSPWTDPLIERQREKQSLPENQINPNRMIGDISLEEPVIITMTGELAQMASTPKTDRSPGYTTHMDPLPQDQDKIDSEDARNFNNWDAKSRLLGYRKDTTYKNHRNLAMVFRANPTLGSHNVVGVHASLTGNNPDLPGAAFQDAFNQYGETIVGQTFTLSDKKGHTETVQIIDAHTIPYANYDTASRYNPSGEIGAQLVADAKAKGQLPPVVDDEPVFKDLGPDGLNVPQNAQGADHITFVTCFGQEVVTDVRGERVVITVKQVKPTQQRKW